MDKEFEIIKEALVKQIEQLKDRLSEYEIISADIADLSNHKREINKLKEENELLKAELKKYIPETQLTSMLLGIKFDKDGKPILRNNVLDSKEVDNLLNAVREG